MRVYPIAPALLLTSSALLLGSSAALAESGATSQGDWPTYGMKPKEFIHDVYTISTYGEDMDEWNFEKLKIRR